MDDVAAEQILWGDKLMRETIDMSTQPKLIGVEVASFGDPFIENDEGTAIVLKINLVVFTKESMSQKTGKCFWEEFLLAIPPITTDYSKFIVMLWHCHQIQKI